MRAPGARGGRDVIRLQLEKPRSLRGGRSPSPAARGPSLPGGPRAMMSAWRKGDLKKQAARDRRRQQRKLLRGGGDADAEARASRPASTTWQFLDEAEAAFVAALLIQTWARREILYKHALPTYACRLHVTSLRAAVAVLKTATKRRPPPIRARGATETERPPTADAAGEEAAQLRFGRYRDVDAKSRGGGERVVARGEFEVRREQRTKEEPSLTDRSDRTPIERPHV